MVPLKASVSAALLAIAASIHAGLAGAAPQPLGFDLDIRLSDQAAERRRAGRVAGRAPAATTARRVQVAA